MSRRTYSFSTFNFFIFKWKNFWLVFSKWFLRVQRKIFEKFEFVRKETLILFFIFFGLWSIDFRLVLSKLHSTYPEQHFEEKNICLKKHSCMIIFWFWAKIVLNVWGKIFSKLVKTEFYVFRETFRKKFGTKTIIFWTLSEKFLNFVQKSSGRIVKTALYVSRAIFLRKIRKKFMKFFKFYDFYQKFQFLDCELNILGRVIKTSFFMSRGTFWTLLKNVHIHSELTKGYIMSEQLFIRNILYDGKQSGISCDFILTFRPLLVTYFFPF